MRNGGWKPSAAFAAAAGSAAAVLFALFRWVIASPGRVEWSIQHLSRPLRRALGSITEKLPLSVMELCYLFLGLGLLWRLFRTLVLLRRGRGRRLKLLACRFLALLSALALIPASYCWLWALDYRGAGFCQRTGFQVEPVDAEALGRTAALFLGEANGLADRVPRDEEGRITGKAAQVLAAYRGLCDPLVEEYPLLEGPSFQPKAMVASRFMSRLGFTGVYFPFTGETNVNVDEPLSLLPHTLAHELCHQRGIYEEDVCNYLGVLACVKNGDVRFQYAGWFAGLIYLMNDLYRLDPGAWRELRAQFSPLLAADWAENSAYWASFEGKTEKVAGKVYDSYLKSNGQELGLLSYNACVRLLVGYFDPGSGA